MDKAGLTRTIRAIEWNIKASLEALVENKSNARWGAVYHDIMEVRRWREELALYMQDLAGDIHDAVDGAYYSPLDHAVRDAQGR